MFQEQYRQFIAEVLEEAKVLLKEMRPPFDRPHVFDDDYVNEWFAIRPDCLESDTLIMAKNLPDDDNLYG